MKCHFGNSGAIGVTPNVISCFTCAGPTEGDFPPHRQGRALETRTHSSGMTHSSSLPFRSKRGHAACGLLLWFSVKFCVEVHARIGPRRRDSRSLL